MQTYRRSRRRFGTRSVNRRIIGGRKKDLLHHSDEQTIPPQRLTVNTNEVGEVLGVDAGKMGKELTRGQ